MRTRKRAKPANKPARKISNTQKTKGKAYAARTTPNRVPSRGDEEE